MLAALALLLLPPAPAQAPAQPDARFLRARVAELRELYESHASSQRAEARHRRTGVVRELAHLPLVDAARADAGALLAEVVRDDRSYRVRAAAALAAGNVGTDTALRATVEALFGRDGRSHRFELLHTLFPEVVARLHHPDDLDWIDLRILRPAASGGASAALRAAGPLADELVASTLEGVGRGGLRALGPRCAELARGGRGAVRVAALRALARLDWPDPGIDAAAGADDHELRAAAALHPGLGREQVARTLGDASPLVRRAALDRLARRPPREAVPRWIARLEAETSTALRLWIAELLHRATGKDFGLDPDLWRSWWAARGDTFDGPAAPEQQGRSYFFELGLRTETVTFVIDVSASMEREDETGRARIERAADELGRALRGLPARARFRVVAFASEVRAFPPVGQAPLPRTASGVALEWFRERKPAGATNTLGALMTALLDPVRPDTIVLLSDGNPYRCSWQGETWSQHEQILARVDEANRARGIRIHTVALLGGARGIGEEEDPEAAARFLARVAARNDGDFREVR